MIEPNQIFSYREMRKALGISEGLAVKLRKAGKLVPQIAGNRYIFTGQQILDYLNGDKTIN